MPIEFESEKDAVVVFRVSGKLGKAELDRAYIKCEELIKKVGRVKLLAITDNFLGWEGAEGWEDMSFQERNDPYIEKIAIVGEEKWRDLAYAFTLKGLRPVPIEYFGPGQELAARQWLA